MAKHVKRSVLPIYLVGVVWLVYALLFPLRTAGQYLVCAALSAVAFVIGKALFPDKAYQMPGEEPKEQAKEQPKAEKKPVYCAEVLQKEVRAREKQEREAKRGERRAEPKAEKAPREPAVLGEEVRDGKSEQIRTFLSGLLEHMDAKAEVKVYEVEKNRYKVILEGEKLGALIGRRGETLDAIQQLTNYSINRGGESKRARVQIDAENYREKREESLERLAQKVAGKVVKYRRNVTLEPMNAYERHVIHTALQDTQYITTFSIGTEPNRRVVVSYDRTKQ